MSHELRTPLNAILGFSAIVLRGAKLSDQHRRDLGIVERSGEHLLGLIDDVLDMAKIESGSVTVECRGIDLHSLIEDTANMLRERAQAKGLDLHLELSSEVPRFIHSDPGKLRQVLINLIGNALKYTQEGSVFVRVHYDVAGSPTLIFDVEDTGIGIALEHQGLIFDPFVQAETSARTSGVGLGLSISRHFVQLLGGTITLDSKPGSGSRFHVEVPAQKAEASEVRAEAGETEHVMGIAPGQPEYRVLIAEDQKENSLLLWRLLRGAGFEVRVAEDGRQGIGLFACWRPQFIWMDLRLPVLDGLEAARQIRAMAGGREVKIVAVTASAFASQREVLANGFDDFVRKPYRAREIFECMARHLGVQYIYRRPAPDQASNPPTTIQSSDLLDLQPELRLALEEAIVSLNSKRILLIIDRISERNPGLGSKLRHFAVQFAYTPINDAIQRCKPSSAPVGSDC